MKKVLLPVTMSILLLAQLFVGSSAQSAGNVYKQITPESEQAETTNIQINDDPEIQKAIELGFVPVSLQKHYDAQISYAEFCSILDNFTSVLFPEAVAAWQETSSNYRNSGNLMTRMEGALVLLYAAENCGIDATGYNQNIPLEDLIADNVDFYEGVTWDYPLLPDISQTYYNKTLAESENYSWRCELDYADNAKRFVEYISSGNSKTYFDYDEDYSLRLGDAFTRADAIRAVERLYENTRFVQYIPVEDAVCTVSDAAIAMGMSMPEASWKELPDWKGYTVAPGSWKYYIASMLYEEELIKVLKEQGFNFVRVPLDSRLIFKDENMDMVNPAYLETMDDLLEYCAAAGISVCFDLHDMPGFYTGGDDSQITLWDDENTQEIFTAFWHFLAKYYKNVPSNLLSFNLLNEPHNADGDLSDKTYTKVMKKAIDAIRKITPDRLIFADTLGTVFGTPVQGLKNAKIVQAVHAYYLQDNTASWPVYSINGFIHRQKGELIMNGPFSAGTRVTFHISAAHATGNICLKSDGTTVASISLGTEAVGENGCTYIGEEGIDGEFRYYDGVVLEAELPSDCARITLVQEGGWWYSLSGITIDGDYSVKITADCGLVSDETPPALTVSENGEVKAKKENTLATKSHEWLESIFQSYRAFTKKTGTLIMVQEFGYKNTIDYQATLSSADDFLSVLRDYNIPWCSWCGEFGPITDIREYNWCNMFGGESITRESAEYKVVSENYMIDEGLMKVFQKYMNH